MNASEFKQQLLPLNAKLYQVARLLLGNDNDASDVVQDVYLKLWKQRDKLSDVDNMQAYCMAVVRNMCLDRKRAAHLDVVEQPPDELQLAGGEERFAHSENDFALTVSDTIYAKLYSASRSRFHQFLPQAQY